MAFPIKTHVTRDAFDDFLTRAENRSRRFELINGEIVEKVVSEEHGAIVAYLAAQILIFAEAHNLGRTAVEPRHRPADGSDNDLIPDLAFTRYENALPLVTKGAVPRMPDLVVEVKSFDDHYTEMRKKASIYLGNGTQLVWLVYPAKRLIEILRADGDSDILTENDTLGGEDILPGFSLPVKQLFDSIR
jgi:Uma2 family endonuclease